MNKRNNMARERCTYMTKFYKLIYSWGFLCNITYKLKLNVFSTHIERFSISIDDHPFTNMKNLTKFDLIILKHNNVFKVYQLMSICYFLVRTYYQVNCFTISDVLFNSMALLTHLESRYILFIFNRVRR